MRLRESRWLGRRDWTHHRAPGPLFLFCNPASHLGVPLPPGFGETNLSRINSHATGMCSHLGGSLRVTEWAVQWRRCPLEAECCWCHSGSDQQKDEPLSYYPIAGILNWLVKLFTGRGWRCGWHDGASLQWVGELECFVGFFLLSLGKIHLLAEGVMVCQCQRREETCKTLWGKLLFFKSFFLKCGQELIG